MGNSWIKPCEVKEAGLYWYICKIEKDDEYNELQPAVVDKVVESSGRTYFKYKTLLNKNILTFTLGYEDGDEVGEDDLFMMIDRPDRPEPSQD